MLNRRGFLGGLVGILSSGVAPAIVAEPMKLWVPKSELLTLLQPKEHPLFELEQIVDIAWQHKRDIEKAIMHGMNYGMTLETFLKSTTFRGLPGDADPHVAMLAVAEFQRRQRGNY